MTRPSRRVALIGSPLRRRHSQVMHDAAFAAHGIPARYELRELAPEDLDGFVAEARRQQHEAFLKVMSKTRGPEYLESVYLFGTPEEVVASLQARVDAGIGYFMLHTMTPDVGQLDLWLRDIIPHVRFPDTAPAVTAA